MTIKLSSKGGGGGEFVSRFYSGVQSVSAGSSGDVIVLTPPEGQRVKLNSLVSDRTSGTEAGITVTIGGVVVVQSLGLSNNNSSTVNGVFALNSGTRVDRRPVGASCFLGNKNEAITVTKDTGTLEQKVFYTYEFGE